LSSKHTVKRIAAAVIAVSIALMQAFFLLPENVNAGGDNLSIRVQYAAEPGAKIREKAVISRSELAGMAGTYCYSNVTSVGTVMVMKARGVRVTEVISKAGIDINSVKLITFRTDDGYTRNISRNQITGSGYYYPKLNLIEDEPETDPSSDPTQPSSDPTQPSSEPTQPSSDPTKPSSEPTQPSSQPDQEPTAPAGESSFHNPFFDEVFAASKKISYYKRTESGKLIPQSGFDKGAVKVPAVLALEFGSSKEQGRSAESLSMSSKRSYRFCIGQTKLTAGKTTTGSDVTSMDSAHSIYGIDVTLEGYPIKGVRLSVDDPKMVVGSKKTVKAVIDGDSLFSEYVDVNSLVWSSSDESIATVNQKGVVTIKKKGKVTITATAKGGIKGSIVLGGESGKAGAAEQTDKTDANMKDKDKAKEKVKVSPGKLLVKEVTIGDKITSESMQEAASQIAASDSNAQSLDEVESYSRKTAAGAAAGALCLCGGGVAFRIRRFMKEV